MKSVLFLGNGLNRISKNSNSWESLLKTLISVSNTQIRNIKDKPFPLLYEEIVMTAIQNKTASEKKLIDIVSSSAKKMEDNNYHKKFSSLCNEILTTNYDYTIEHCINEKECIYKKNIQEKRYSLFRYNVVEGKRIWHIHGEANNKKSMCLGYEFYGSNIQSIKNYLINGKEKILPIRKRLLEKSNTEIEGSWIDYFFNSNIYIVGLELDFQEMDLWWLLDYRARLINMDKFNIHNNIYYYTSNKIDQVKRELLTSLKVNVVEITVNTTNKTKLYNPLYDEIYNKIRNQLQRDAIAQ